MGAFPHLEGLTLKVPLNRSGNDAGEGTILHRVGFEPTGQI
jgi:hypothetical protein